MSHNTNKAAKANTNTKGNFVSLTGSQAATIAAKLLRQYGSRQAIKGQHGAELIAKYGRDNFKAIDKAIQGQRAEYIAALADKVRAGLRDWEPAAREAMAAARKGGHFAKLAAMAAAKYGTAAEFIAACYPNTIDGAPATLVQYVTGPEAATIVAAYQLATIDGRNARAIIDTCLGKFERALNAANKGAKCFKAPAVAREAGKIVAAYNVKPGAALGTIAKAEPVSPEALAQYAKGNTQGLTTLAAYNGEARKAYNLAAAAEAVAAISGEELSPEAVAVLAREPRHNWLTRAPKAEAKPAKAPKGGKAPKGPKGPKAPKVSPEAAKAAREAMAQVDATIAAGVAVGRELSGAAEREAKAMAAAEAKAAKIAMLAEA